MNRRCSTGFSLFFFIFHFFLRLFSFELETLRVSYIQQLHLVLIRLLPRRPKNKQSRLQLDTGVFDYFWKGRERTHLYRWRIVQGFIGCSGVHTQAQQDNLAAAHAIPSCVSDCGHGVFAPSSSEVGRSLAHHYIAASADIIEKNQKDSRTETDQRRLFHLYRIIRGGQPSISLPNTITRLIDVLLYDS